MFICGIRYGNVMVLRGLVIFLFIEKIKVGEFLMIIDFEMIRFLMSLEDVVELVVYVFKYVEIGDIMV